MAREKGMGNLQREKSGRWTMRVGICGKRFCRSTRTKDKDKAERYLQRFLAQFGLGEKRLPLADVWNSYVMSPDRNDLSPATLNSKRIVWMHFARWMERYHLAVTDLSGVTHDVISEYLALLRSDLCGSTYNSKVCVLREIFHTLAEKAGLEEDPWQGVRLRPDDCHSRRELTMDELRRLLAAAKAVDVRRSRTKEDTNIHCTPTPSTSEWYKLFLIGIYTGLRLGDCCKLDWSSINLGQGIIQLIPSKTRRHAHGRPVTIPIHQTLGAALLESGECEDPSAEKCTAPTSPLGTQHPSHYTGPVLPTICEMYHRGRWLVSQELSRIFKAANIVTSVKIEGRKNKTPEASFHSLRHSFVSFSANAGVPLHVVQSIVGHESTAMTRHYYHESMDALRSAVNAIPALG